MGAEGGICWIKLKKPECRDRAIILIDPLHLIIDQSSFRDEDNEWLDNNEWPQPPDSWIMSKYGTDMDHSGMETLAHILLYENEIKRLETRA